MTQDMSVFGLFMLADPFVKLIMLGLLFTSIMVWAIWLAKSLQMGRLHRQARQFEDAFASGQDLEAMYGEMRPQRASHPMAKLFIVGTQSFREIENETADEDGFRPRPLMRVRRQIDITLTREMEQIESWLPFLATVGSTAPFIGLLGTVWGIMNSFQGIAEMQNTSLAVVAPGIAEALLATALGLFAAIPAVIAYNRLSNSVGRYAGRLETFAMEFIGLLEKKREKIRSAA